MKIHQKEKGFTIIEVVLVLAIAALIFLMVFIALPALQRSQRDTQRKNDLSRMMTQLTSYSSNNRGSIPADLITQTGTPPLSFVQRYLAGTSTTDPSSHVTTVKAGADYQDPQAGSYTFIAEGAAPPSTPVIGNIYYDTSAICSTDGSIITGSSRQYALRMFLEGQQSPYCVDNH